MYKETDFYYEVIEEGDGQMIVDYIPIDESLATHRLVLNVDPFILEGDERDVKIKTRSFIIGSAPHLLWDEETGQAPTQSIDDPLSIVMSKNDPAFDDEDGGDEEE